MRKIDILNKNYDGVGLDTPLTLLNGKTLRDVFEKSNQITSLPASQTLNGMTIVNNGKGSLILTGTASSEIDLSLGSTVKTFGVRYYFRGSFANGGSTTYGLFDPILSWQIGPSILSAAGSSSTSNTRIIIKVGITLDNAIFTPVFLTITSDLSAVTKHDLDYAYNMYRYLKFKEQISGYHYLPSGISKYDVAYINKTIDDPIAELNGHTLREVFEGGKVVIDNITNEHPARITFTRTGVSDYSVEYLPNITQHSGAYKMNTYAANKKYYVRQSISNIVSDQNINFMWYNGTIWSNYISTKNNFEMSYIFQNPAYNLWTFQITVLTNTGSSKTFRLSNIFSIELYGFGIENLSKEQLDYYYSLYIARKPITKKILTYADIFEKFQDILNNTLDTTSNWVTGGSILSVEDNTLKVKENGTVLYAYGWGNTGFSAINEEKYYARAEMMSQDVLASIRFSLYVGPTINDLSNINIIQNPIQNQWYSRSGIFIIYGQTSALRFSAQLTYSSNLGQSGYFKNMYLLNLKHFDELITKEQIDIILNYYLSIKNNIIYPENFLPTEPTGLGNRYKFLESNNKVYGHEMDFEKMQLNLLFGTYRNAYESFNLLMNFMINNEAIISYDYGKGIRYTDVRLIAAPKTELDNGQHMRSKFDFKRLSPFYTIEEGSTLTIKNVHDWDIKPIVSGTVNTNLVYIEAEETTSGDAIGVKFNFTSLTKPFNFYYNAETKQILINGINNGYQYIDFSYGVSFITLPKDTEHIVWTTGITSPIVKAKKWVID